MNIGKIVKAAGCSAVCTLILCGQSAFAVTEYPPEGGQWNYGVGILGSYSDYLNQQPAHGSTVNHNGNKYSAGAPAGQWSQALQAEFFQDVHFITIYKIKQIFVHKRREPESSRFYLGE